MKKAVLAGAVVVLTAVSLFAMAKSPFEQEIIAFCNKFKSAVLGEEPGTRDFFSGRFQGRYGIAVTQPVFFNQVKGMRIRKPGEIPAKILLPGAKFEFLREKADTVVVEVFNNGEKADPPLPTLRKLHLMEENGRWVVDSWEKQD